MKKLFLFLSLIAVSCHPSQTYYYDISKEVNYNGYVTFYTTVNSYWISYMSGPIADHYEIIGGDQSVVQAKEKSIEWAKSKIQQLKQADSILNAQP